MFESTSGEYGLYLHTREPSENPEYEIDGNAGYSMVFPCSKLDGTVKLIEELYDWEQGVITRLASTYRQEGDIKKSEVIENDLTFSKAYMQARKEGNTEEAAMAYAALNEGGKSL